MKFYVLLTRCSLFVVACSLIQCSSSSSKTTSNNPTTDASTSSAAAACDDYCNTIMTNCTGGDQSSASNQQYSAKDNCLAVCAIFPPGLVSDTSGNTLGCRKYHATLAATDPTTHCPHAGPGGDGVCGDTCTGYCQMAEAFCIGTSKIYSSTADCMATCNATGSDKRFNISIEVGFEQACLLYHAQEASLAPADHCLGDLMKAADAGATSGGSVTCGG